MQRFCVSRGQSCLVTVHVTLHMKLMGWGGVGHVNVRWNLLHMTLMLRDEPSLELAQAEWHETKPCFFDEEFLVSLRRNDHFYKNTRTVIGPAGSLIYLQTIEFTQLQTNLLRTANGKIAIPCWCLLELRQRLMGSQLGSARATNWVSTLFKCIYDKICIWYDLWCVHCMRCL